MTAYVIPYWLIVTPLTLSSIGPLLGKPRSVKEIDAG